MHAELIREVEQLLYREARLLDERRFHAWLDLFTDDVRYWMPVRSTRYPTESKAIVILDPDRYVEAELGQEDDIAIFNETKETLGRRIARLETGMAWAADPPSHYEYRGGARGHCGRTEGLLAFSGVSPPGRDGARLLHRGPAGCATAGPGRVENCPPHDHPRPDRPRGEERQHLFLKE